MCRYTPFEKVTRCRYTPFGSKPTLGVWGVVSGGCRHTSDNFRKKASSIRAVFLLFSKLLLVVLCQRNTLLLIWVYLKQTNKLNLFLGLLLYIIMAKAVMCFHQFSVQVLLKLDSEKQVSLLFRWLLYLALQYSIGPCIWHAHNARIIM